MRGNKWWSRAVVAVSLATLYLPVSAATLSAHEAGASTTTCPFGVDVSTDAGLSVSLAGTPLTEVSSAPPVFGASGTLYEVNLCRNLDVTGQDNVYFFNVLPATLIGSDYVVGDFGPSDIFDVFTIRFTPTGGDIPLEIEAHGKISSYDFSGTSPSVTFNVSPLSFNDLHGCPPDPTSVSGCCLGQAITVGGVTGPETPEQCASRVEVASDNAVQLWGGVRFQTSTGVGSGNFGNLIGMQVSAASFVYYTNAQCPTYSPNQTGSGVSVNLAGPHFEPDGTTLATGSLGVFIPASAIAQCFGTTPALFAASMSITRTELGSTVVLAPMTSPGTGEYYTVTSDSTGVRFYFPIVTYSEPHYGFATLKSRALDRSLVTFASLEKKSGEKLPKSGHWKVAAKAGSKVCVTGTSAIFGFAKGTCLYSVAALTSTGKVSVTKNGTFTVK